MEPEPTRLDTAPPAADAIDWAGVERALQDSKTYWLATVRPDGSPHVVPLWCVWVDRRLYLSTGEGSRKARNLAAQPRCVVTLEAGGLHLSLEGHAARATDRTELQRIVELYGAKYDWPLTVGDDGRVTDQYGNGGPVFRFTPDRLLAFRPEADGLKTARWRF